jgi:hypothetical protein
MKLWLISQDENDDYDTYDSAVVAAETESEARSIHPGDNQLSLKNGKWVGTRPDGTEYESYSGTWSRTDAVKVEYIGEAKEGTEKGIICASFNAG